MANHPNRSRAERIVIAYRAMLYDEKYRDQFDNVIVRREGHDRFVVPAPGGGSCLARMSLAEIETAARTAAMESTKSRRDINLAARSMWWINIHAAASRIITLDTLARQQYASAGVPHPDDRTP